MNGAIFWGPSISLRIGELFGTPESSKSQGNWQGFFSRTLSISDWTRDQWKGVRFWGVFFSSSPDRDSIRGVDFLVCLIYKSIFAHRNNGAFYPAFC